MSTEFGSADTSADTAATSQPPPAPDVAAKPSPGSGNFRDPWGPYDDVLRKHIAAGLSFSHAAAQINAEFGTKFSRNAAIGRAHRIGVTTNRRLFDPRKDTSAPKAKRKYYKPKTKPTRSTPFVPKPVFKCDELTWIRVADVEPLHIDLLDLGAGQCRWPYGDGPFTFCGHPVLDGSYCFEHHQLGLGDPRGRHVRDAAYYARLRKRTKSAAEALRMTFTGEDAA